MMRWRRRRVAYVPQLQVTECGAACLTMVAAYHGKHVSLSETRMLCQVSRDGTSVGAISRAALELGLTARVFAHVAPDALGRRPLPCILHWKMNHFVVLEAIDERYAHLVDPASGPIRLPIPEFRAAFTGVALFLTPGASFVRKRRDRPSISRYLRVAGGTTGAAAVLVACLLMLEMLSVVLPASTQTLIDLVVKPRDQSWLPVTGLVLLAVILLRFALSWVRDRVLAGMRVLLDVGVFRSFLTHLFSLPLTFFQQRSTGDLLSRVTGLTAVRDMMVRVTTGILDALLVATYVVLMLGYDVRLATAVIAVSLLRVGVLLWIHQRTSELASTELSSAAEELTVVMEVGREPEAIKAFGMEQHMAERYARSITPRLNAEAATAAAVARGAASMPALEALSRVLVLWLGGQAVFADRMTLGTVASFLVIETLIGPPLESLLSLALTWRQIQEKLVRADEVWSLPPETSGAANPGIFTGALSLEGVGFRYGSEAAPVLQNVSFDVAAGQFVALVGRSGAGKSTLAMLLTGLLSPTEGCVRIDGQDLRNLDTRAVRRQIGVVSQDAFLLDDTIRANITLGDRDMPSERIEEAIRGAHLEDVLRSLPDGLDTRIGPNGARLSGGQRQRLVLARALARNPRILILDEATSALDLELEQNITDYLDRLSCTRIVIAHRARTIQRADCVYVIDRARLADQGTYTELASRPGPFRSLCFASWDQ
jgi:ATP-binding cassette, subfamily B, bacterial